jgi:hypothetical protein
MSGISPIPPTPWPAWRASWSTWWLPWRGGWDLTHGKSEGDHSRGNAVSSSARHSVMWTSCSSYAYEKNVGRRENIEKKRALNSPPLFSNSFSEIAEATTVPPSSHSQLAGDRELRETALVAACPSVAPFYHTFACATKQRIRQGRDAPMRCRYGVLTRAKLTGRRPLRPTCRLHLESHVAGPSGPTARVISSHTSPTPLPPTSEALRSNTLP